MKAFSALVVLAMGSTTAVGAALGWTSAVMEGTKVAGIQAVGPLTFIVTTSVAGALDDTFTITSSAKIWQADASTACTVVCGTACATATLVCATVGNVLTCTSKTVAVTASAVTIACADNFAKNPDAGTGAATTVTFTAVASNTDTTSASDTNVGYDTTAGPTLGWTSGLMAGTLVSTVQAVGPLTFIVTPTQAHAVGSKITITSSAKIFKEDAATTTCKVTCATACDTATLACTVSGSGTKLVCTTEVVTLTASAVTIVCTTNLAVNPAAAAITFAAVSNLDTSSNSATNAGYTTAAAATNETNASNSTNATTTASLLINSAASVVSPGAVAFLLASLY